MASDTNMVAARLARAVTHPDRGGDITAFQQVQTTICVLEDATRADT